MCNTGSDSTTESNNHLENETPLASDGNRNNQQSPDEVISNKSQSSNEESNNELNNKSMMKTTVHQLKEICDELCSQVMIMKSEREAKEKICADVGDVDDDDDDDDDDEDEDEGEEDERNENGGNNKSIKAEKEESRGNGLLLSELQSSRRIIAELEAKLLAFNVPSTNSTTDTKKVNVQTDTDELILLNAFNDSCETLHHSSVENLNARRTTDAVTQTSPQSMANDSSVSNTTELHHHHHQSKHIDSDNKSQIDHSIIAKNLDVAASDASVAGVNDVDDMKMLCDPNVEREEQLIAFKEHCAELTESNLLLKNQLNDMQMRLLNGQSIISNRMAIVAPIAVVILCWLILPYL